MGLLVPLQAMSTPPLITGLDHVVLTVASIPRTIAFYEQTLGFLAHEFKHGRYALHFGRQKINLHEVGTVVDANVRHATPGSADLCFLTEVHLDDVMAHLTEVGVDVVQGPVNATGACARLRSIYFYDPDENLIEVANEVADVAVGQAV
jgi:catechol 2,3-dioxygenase-like lactoylglutathione lyase family enzyme